MGTNRRKGTIGPQLVSILFSIGWKDFINLYIVAKPSQLGLT